jgi:hypothetical protein
VEFVANAFDFFRVFRGVFDSFAYAETASSSGGSSPQICANPRLKHFSALDIRPQCASKQEWLHEELRAE